MENSIKFKYAINDAVWWGDRIARVEDTAIDGNGEKVYLIQLSNLHYIYAYEHELEVYLG